MAYRSAMSVRSIAEWRSDRITSHMIGRVSAPALLTMGRSASAGSRPSAVCTALLTSVAAASMSRPGRNSTVIVLPPKELTEVMSRMPSMPFRRCSIGSVTVASTVCGLAPTYVVLTETTGLSTSGYSRTGSAW